MTDIKSSEEFDFESNLENLFKQSRDIYEEHLDLIERLNNIVEATENPINPVITDIVTLYNDKIENVYSGIYENYKRFLIFRGYKPLNSSNKED